jgi:GT2 family glycosyltransferase
MDVSIIIVNNNTNRWTQDRIDCVFDKTKGLEFEVIVVDNGSTDGSKEHFEKDDRIKYIYCIENMGFGRVNNLGFKHAKGDYVFLLNSDTCLINNAILEFYYYMRSAPLNVGCLGCLMMDREGMPIHSYGEFPGVRYFMWRVLTCYGINLSFLLSKPYADKKNLWKWIIFVGQICSSDEMLLKNMGCLILIFSSISRKQKCNIVTM